MTSLSEMYHWRVVNSDTRSREFSYDEAVAGLCGRVTELLLGAMNARRQALHGASPVMEIKPYPGAGGFYADDN